MNCIQILLSFYGNFAINDRVGHFCCPHGQSSVKINLPHPIENRYATLVPVMLTSRCEIDTKAIYAHWLDGLHMPRPNAFAPTAQHCATIVEWFYPCPTMKGFRKLETSVYR